MSTRATPATGDQSPVGSSHQSAMARWADDDAFRSEVERLAPYESLARLVIARRMALDLTQKELAERMATSHSAISRIERGQHPTTVETLRRLADALETHLVVGFSDELPSETDDRELIAIS